MRCDHRGNHGAEASQGFTNPGLNNLLRPELLTTRQAATICGLGERTLWRHSRSGLAPAPRRIGGAVRYRRSEIKAWIDAGCPVVGGSA